MSLNSRSVLITSAAGNIGQKLVPLLLSTDSTSAWTIVLPTRNASRLVSTIGLPTPLPPNIIVAEGDTSDTPWLEKLLVENNVDTVFSNFSFTEELILTFNLWSACENSGVKHLVYLSACFDTSLEGVRAGSLKNVGAAHCMYKWPAEQKLLYGSPKFTWTVLAPALFFVNDAMGKDLMLNEGIYIHPIGNKGCSKVDTADIALAAHKAMHDGGKQYAGRKIYLGSKKAYTADDIAKLWGAALEKEIKTASDDKQGLAKAESRVKSMGIDNAMARDFYLMFHQFAVDGMSLTAEQYDEQVAFLGKEASSYEDFVKTTAPTWLAKA